MIDRLITEASEFYGLSGGAFFSPARGYTTRAREAITRVALDRLGWSVPRIARHLRKDKRAIYEADARSKERLRDDPIFYELVSRLEKIVSPYDADQPL